MSEEIKAGGYPHKPNKRTKDEMSLDMLFGLHATTDALLKAIIDSHPDCEKLLRQYDMRLEQGINTACKSDRSVLELAAALDYGKVVREVIQARADDQRGEG